MALRAVFLDLDDTLVATSEHDVRAFSHAATVADERAGPLDRERLVADVRAGIKRAPWDPEYVVEVTEWRAALWASALENQGISAGTGGALALGAELQREYDANRMNDFPFMPEVPDAVAHLRKRGLRVVVITNGHHVVQRDKLAACAAHVLFPKPETIIVGGEEVLAGRPEKPHESIFLRACDVAGCAPNQAVHVGDSLAADVQGGVNAKLRATVWVNPTGKALREGDPTPTHVVTTVGELPDIVDRMLEEDARARVGS